MTIEQLNNVRLYSSVVTAQKRGSLVLVWEQRSSGSRSERGRYTYTSPSLEGVLGVVSGEPTSGRPLVSWNRSPDQNRRTTNDELDKAWKKFVIAPSCRGGRASNPQGVMLSISHDADQDRDSRIARWVATGSHWQAQQPHRWEDPTLPGVRRWQTAFAS